MFHFGPFVLDVANAELRRDGVPVKLQPQPFKALHLLVDRAGTLVSRDELVTALWGGESFVDFNAGLNFCLAQLRAALGETAAEPTYIQTVPRRGYRFVAAVERIEPVETQSTSVASPEPALPPTVAVPGPIVRTTPRVTRGWTAAAAVAAAAALLVLAVSQSPAARPARHSPAVAARAAFERGALGLLDASPEELSIRVARFDAAIELDAQYAEPYAWRATAELLLGGYRERPPAEAYAAAKASAARALELTPDLAEAHAALGAALMRFDWNWPAAGDHLRRAVALDPRSAIAQLLYSDYASAIGDHRAAIRAAGEAVRLTPGSASAKTRLGMAHFFAGEFDRAVAGCAEALELLPAFVPARFCAGMAAAESGAFDVALDHIAALRRATDAAPRLAVPPPTPSATDATAFWSGRLSRLRAGLPGTDCQCQTLAVAVALAHLGMADDALVLLERAADLRSDSLLFAGVHPALARLQGERRFQRVLERVGLPATR